VGGDGGDLPDVQAAHLHVGLLGELVADPVDLERHRHAAVERPGVTADRQPDERQQHDDEQQPLQPAFHPATRTEVSVPNSTSVRKKSRIAVLTIDSRTERPTAVPTPAGPPLAVYP